MGSLTPPSGSLKQISASKYSLNSSQKDLWAISREGSLAELNSALLLPKKNNGNINSRNAFGVTPLHIATWRNHVPIVKRLLASGADPDLRDGESGWTSLHRALHFGHLAVAGILLQSGASLMVEDFKGRTPVDLLSGPVSQTVGNNLQSEVLSWGSGANYQLGTGNTDIQKLPCKVDAFEGSSINIVAASKFHSAAVIASGELYTWGFGRGGRLGHPDFDIHSGQAAVILPQQVTLGLGSRRVKAIAAAKHHTVIATEGGEVFTWGSNREGQLGYTSVDTQPTPRRVSSFRVKIIAVAAANKHTAVVAESGEVFTWGCNKEGQLGYGTSNSASNYMPRMVEYLKGKVFKGVSAAKYHTVVLGADGEIFTWGHRLVNPRRLIVSRNIKKSGAAPLKFHRMMRLNVISVAAGVIHSTALTEDGALFYWVSSDPNFRCQQLYSMCGKNVVSISAGKFWTAAVTMTGDVYMWDGKKYKDETPVPTRLHSVKRATSVCVGETHLLLTCSIYHPIDFPKPEETLHKSDVDDSHDLEELDENFMFEDMQGNQCSPAIQNVGISVRAVPSLKSLCEKVAAKFIVEPRNAIQLLEIAISLGADDLSRHCEDIAMRNLDYILTVATQTIASASPEVLAMLEKSLDKRSSEPWSYRRLPTPTATLSAVIDSEEEDSIGCLRLHDDRKNQTSKDFGVSRTGCFLPTDSAADEAALKQVRVLRKKLQQIEMLEAKHLNGYHLDDQQIAKLQTRYALKGALAELGVPLETDSKLHMPNSSDGKTNKKMARKHRKNGNQKPLQSEGLCMVGNRDLEHTIVKGFQVADSLQLSKVEEGVDINATGKEEVIEDVPLPNPKVIANSSNSKVPQLTCSKKKNKKGGLSMFLSGALDDAPKYVPPSPSPSPKSEGPAWGGAKLLKEPTSLRDIQNEQSKTKDILSVRRKDQAEVLVGVGNRQRPFSSFIPDTVSIPIAEVPARSLPASQEHKKTPSWSSLGTPPILSRPSLRDIQMQQEEKKKLAILHSPKTRTLGFAVSSSQGKSPESICMKDAIPNRWFKPELESPSSIRSIQIEERAIKDLKRFYNSVKIVKAPSH